MKPAAKGGIGTKEKDTSSSVTSRYHPRGPRSFVINHAENQPNPTNAAIVFL
jgi:hypothetical protein